MDDLPLDIIRYIIPFTYNVQPKELLDEIKTYRGILRMPNGHRITPQMLDYFAYMGSFQYVS